MDEKMISLRPALERSNGYGKMIEKIHDQYGINRFPLEDLDALINGDINKAEFRRRVTEGHGKLKPHFSKHLISRNPNNDGKLMGS